MTPVQIPNDLRAAIYAHACAAYPEECCGYLCGPARGLVVDTVIACRNARRDADPARALEPPIGGRGADTAFAITGPELLQFARRFDDPQPPRIVYHSHTNGRAYFSALDRAVAAGPAYPVQHLVVGVTADEPGPRVVEAAQFAWSEPANDYVEVARWSVP